MPIGFGHAAYKAYVFVRPEMLSKPWTRDGILALLCAQGIPAYVGSCSEVYREVAFEEAGLAPTNRLPVAKELGETSLMFLVHPTLAQEHIDQVCKA